MKASADPTFTIEPRSRGRMRARAALGSPHLPEKDDPDGPLEILSGGVPDGVERRGHSIIHPDVYLAELRFHPPGGRLNLVIALTSVGIGGPEAQSPTPP
jgi:hypothetical protein